MRGLGAERVTDCARTIDSLRTQINASWRDPLAHHVVTSYWDPWVREVRQLAVDLQVLQASMATSLAKLHDLTRHSD